jgi:hypothetical protein
MATAETQNIPAEPAAPALPDYLTDADATSKDEEAAWRYGKAPDYSKTRKVWEDSEYPPLQLTSDGLVSQAVDDS